MKRCFLFVSLCAACGQAAAEIYKYTDANGNITYSSVPRKGAKKLDLRGSSPPASTASKPHSAHATASPADFPRVSGGTQKSRDDMRRKILEDEMSKEEKLLQESRRALQEEQKKQLSNPGQNEKNQSLSAESALHAKNIEALQTEIRHIR